MPWKETCPMDQLQFIADYHGGKTCVCSTASADPRVTSGLPATTTTEPKDSKRSRRPHHHPDTTAPEVAARIVHEKLAHPTFGEGYGPPARCRTRHALASRQHRRRHPQAKRPGQTKAQAPPRDPRALVTCDAPAQSWSADFKGDFTWQWSVLLTITQPQQCRALHRMTTDGSPGEWVFREYACPRRCAPTMARPLPRRRWSDQLSKWWVWAFARSTRPPHRVKTVATNACIGRSRKR